MDPDLQSNLAILGGMTGAGALAGAANNALMAPPGYRTEGAVRGALGGLPSGLASFAFFKLLRDAFDPSKMQSATPLHAAGLAGGGILASDLLFGSGRWLPNIVMGRPSWEVRPDNLLDVLRQDQQKARKKPAVGDLKAAALDPGLPRKKRRYENVEVNDTLPTLGRMAALAPALGAMGVGALGVGAGAGIYGLHRALGYNPNFLKDVHQFTDPVLRPAQPGSTTDFLLDAATAPQALRVPAYQGKTGRDLLELLQKKTQSLPPSVGQKWLNQEVEDLQNSSSVPGAVLNEKLRRDIPGPYQESLTRSKQEVLQGAPRSSEEDLAAIRGNQPLPAPLLQQSRQTWRDILDRFGKTTLAPTSGWMGGLATMVGADKALPASAALDTSMRWTRPVTQKKVETLENLAEAVAQPGEWMEKVRPYAPYLAGGGAALGAAGLYGLYRLLRRPRLEKRLVKESASRKECSWPDVYLPAFDVNSYGLWRWWKRASSWIPEEPQYPMSKQADAQGMLGRLLSPAPVGLHYLPGDDQARVALSRNQPGAGPQLRLGLDQSRRYAVTDHIPGVRPGVIGPVQDGPDLVRQVKDLNLEDLDAPVSLVFGGHGSPYSMEVNYNNHRSSLKGYRTLAPFRGLGEDWPEGSCIVGDNCLTGLLPEDPNAFQIGRGLARMSGVPYIGPKGFTTSGNPFADASLSQDRALAWKHRHHQIPPEPSWLSYEPTTEEQRRFDPDGSEQTLSNLPRTALSSFANLYLRPLEAWATRRGHGKGFTTNPDSLQNAASSVRKISIDPLETLAADQGWSPEKTRQMGQVLDRVTQAALPISAAGSLGALGLGAAGHSRSALASAVLGSLGALPNALAAGSAYGGAALINQATPEQGGPMAYLRALGLAAPHLALPAAPLAAYALGRWINSWRHPDKDKGKTPDKKEKPHASARSRIPESSRQLQPADAA